jgi:hypothetical protein
MKIRQPESFGEVLTGRKQEMKLVIKGAVVIRRAEVNDFVVKQYLTGVWSSEVDDNPNFLHSITRAHFLFWQDCNTHNTHDTNSCIATRRERKDGSEQGGTPYNFT